MAFTIGRYGVAALKPLAYLMGSFYLTCLLFILVVLGSIASAGCLVIDGRTRTAIVRAGETAFVIYEVQCSSREGRPRERHPE